MQGVLASATEKFGSQSELFGTKIAEAATRLDRAVEFAAAGLGRGAEDAARRLDEQVTTSSVTLGGALNRAGDEFAGKLDGVISEIGRSLGPLGERLAGFQASLEGLDERLRTQAAAFGEVATRTRANVELLDATAAKLRDAGAPGRGQRPSTEGHGRSRSSGIGGPASDPRASQRRGRTDGGHRRNPGALMGRLRAALRSGRPEFSSRCSSALPKGRRLTTATCRISSADSTLLLTVQSRPSPAALSSSNRRLRILPTR